MAGAAAAAAAETAHLVHGARVAHVLPAQHLHPVEQDALDQDQRHGVGEVLRLARVSPGGQVRHASLATQPNVSAQGEAETDAAAARAFVSSSGTRQPAAPSMAQL